MKIWVDLSLYKETRGTPFGISRVESALIEKLPHEGLDVGFFWQDEKNLLYFSLESSLTDNSDLSKGETDYSRDQFFSGAFRNESLTSKIRILLAVSLSFFPQSFSNLVWAFLSAARKVIKSMSKFFRTKEVSFFFNSVFSAIKRLLHSPQIEQDPIFPQRGDIFLIANNDWERFVYKNLAKTLGYQPRLGFVVYDLIPYSNPELAVDFATSSRFTFWIGDIAQKAEFIFYISQFTKESFDSMLVDRNIVTRFKSKVISLPPGITCDGEESEPQFSSRLESVFILVVSTLEVRKNHKILLEAMNEASRLHEKFPQLIFIGSKGWGYEAIRRELELNEKITKRVIHIEGVSDQELRWLYRRCMLVAYPSLIEGLGLPILEAKQFGKKVLVSTASSFKDIVEDSDVVISPHDALAWKSEIQKEMTLPQVTKEEAPSLRTWSHVVTEIAQELAT